jgi:hypothetical protein
MGAQKHNIDEEPLLVNTINSWALRPDAITSVPNLFLASDYVRTNTDLATMEGANEAARRAVNGIIEISKSKVELCKVWPLKEPWILAPLKWFDKSRYDKGLQYTDQYPIWLKIFMFFWSGAYLITSLVIIFFKKLKFI